MNQRDLVEALQARDDETSRQAAKEIERLQRVIHNRPAINAGLPETYIVWSSSIYEMEIAEAAGLYRS